MKQDFYLRFENRFRGDRESVRQRQESYLPMLEPLAAVFPGACALDLGCGRGEWLELLSEQGFSAQGIDTDACMVEHCRSHGLSVEENDAISALKARQAESVAVVSGFHIIEHLPFDTVLTLVEEAHRVLVPGGLLILETPNPENLMVGTWSFYMDPTHRHPLPPDLMQFVGEEAGFLQARILRLNGPEQPGPDAAFSARFRAILSDAPDYSLVAHKASAKGEKAVLFDYLETLDNRRAMVQERLEQALADNEAEQARLRQEKQEYEHRLNQESQELERLRQEKRESEHRLNQESQELERLRQEKLESERRLDQAMQELDSARNEQQRLNETLGLVKDDTDALRHELAAIYQSRSWRLTKPLRLAAWQLRRPDTFTRRTIVRPGIALLKCIPGAKRLARWGMNRHPALKARIERLRGRDAAPENSLPSSSHLPLEEAHLSLEELSERQARIFLDLKRTAQDGETS